jgi:hypothetical protein
VNWGMMFIMPKGQIWHFAQNLDFMSEQIYLTDMFMLCRYLEWDPFTGEWGVDLGYRLDLVGDNFILKNVARC